MVSFRLAGIAAGVATLGAAAPVVHAQTPTLTWQFSTDSGQSWKQHGAASAFSTVLVRAVVDWSGVSAYGFSGLSQKVFIDNFSPGEGGAQINPSGIGNRVAPFNFGVSTLAIRVQGTTQRIIALGLEGSLEEAAPMAQFAPAYSGASYASASPVTIFSFRYIVGGVENRTITIRSEIAPLLDLPRAFAFHSSASSTNTSFRLSGEMQAATILVIPMPATAALFASAGVVLLRRRR